MEKKKPTHIIIACLHALFVYNPLFLLNNIIYKIKHCHPYFEEPASVTSSSKRACSRHNGEQHFHRDLGSSPCKSPIESWLRLF